MARGKELDVSVVPTLFKFSQKHRRVSYHEAIDGLYVGLTKPQCDDDSLRKGNLVYYYAWKMLVRFVEMRISTYECDTPWIQKKKLN